MRARRRGRVGNSLLLLLAAALLGALFVPVWIAHAGAGPTISPASAMVSPRGTQTFTASGGSGAGYVWSLTMAPSGGTISAAGLYTAGTQANVIDVVQVVDSASNTTTAQVMVGAGITITPPTATLATGATQTFVADGGSPPYVWTLSASSGAATLSATGAYTAGANPGTDTVQAADSLGNNATATVTVVAAASLGTPCTTANDCPAGASGDRYCVDFVCCSSACSGQCQACNTAGSAGTCVTISGPPVGTRPACSGGSSSEPCSAKACDGKNPNACDVFVGSSVTCSAAMCVDGVGTPQAVCLGDGGCQPVVPTACGAFACVSGACATSCTDDSDCSPGSYCNVTTAACVNPTAAAASAEAGATPPSSSGSSGCSIGPMSTRTSPIFTLVALTGVLVTRRRRRLTGVSRAAHP